MTSRQERLHKVLVLLRVLSFLCLLVFSGCTEIRLISEYDEQTDKSITQFQRKIEAFLISLERNIGTEQAKYENNTQYYDEFKVDLSAIRVRAAAIPKNSITIQQIDLLIDSLNNLEKLHQHGLTREDIGPLRTAFNTSCTAILKLELAKKRGEI